MISDETIMEIKYQMMLDDEEYLLITLNTWLNDWLHRRSVCPNCEFDYQWEDV